MTDMEMSMDVAPGYNALAAQAEYGELLKQDESRNRFITARYLNDDYIEDPFVAVVVDGDGAIFTDELLNDPILAADRLKDAIRAQLLEMPSLPIGIPIVVRIYANLQGLAKTVTANRIIEHTKMLSFPSQFNFECDSFDFVDVGWNKEAADSKIRTIFNHYYKNKQCRRIFLAGVSHDDGYLNDLKDFKGDQGERITLVESYPARPGFMRFGLPITSFPGIFRNEMLPSHGAPQPTRESQEQRPLQPFQVHQSDHGSVEHVRSDSYPSPVEMKCPTQEKELVREILQGKRKGILYNRNRVRLDRVLKHPGGLNEPHQVSYERKRQGRKFCNQHYLGGGCPKRERGCKLVHNVLLKPEELGVLRFLARTSFRCYTGVRCDDSLCFMSHTCLYPKYECQDAGCKHKVHLEGGPESDDRKPK
ncbi:hypothetical protein PG996_004807 [Apiospora saccharicola]|uniref:C3H1-type domain-containing protein n=1 Tax=Apiospora saccharicola TaxID=335842 RepID=A0ABR1W6F3_9PEZI